MSLRLRHALRPRPARNIVLLFAFTILLPGLVLAAFGLRVLEQDRQLALREIEQRLDLASRDAGELLDRELRASESALYRIASTGSINPAELPRWMQEAAAEPGNLAIAVPNVAVWPSHSVAYLPWNGFQLRLVEDPASTADTLATARADALNARAQAERERGRSDQAASLFRELISLGPSVSIGSIPADLVGRYGLCEVAAPDAIAACGADLHRALTHGTWLLEQPSYLWYRNQAEVWMAGAPGRQQIDSDRLLDKRRRALADALAPERAGDTSEVMLIRFSGGTGNRTTTVAMWRDWVRQKMGPQLLASRLDGEAFDAALSDRAHEHLDATAVGEGLRDATVRTTRHTFGDHHWQVALRPRNAEALLAASSRRRSAYIGVLAGVLSLLAFGTYFTARLVKRELEIARMKSDFVSAVSHEFRSPLTGIRQLSEMLLRGRVPNDERRQEYYQRIAGESDRLTRVVENILDFSRMEDGQKPYRFEPIETSEWLRHVASRIERTLAGGQHRLVSSIPEIAGVFGDREALTTALDNLVDNAVKYSPNADVVWLTAEDRGATVAIHVRDSGHGIAAADRPHIFDRFYRGGAEMTRTAKGTGIGLSLVDHIVRAHRGHVAVASSLGEGSTFSVVLPVASEIGSMREARA